MNNIKGDLKKFKEVKSEELLKIVLEKDELLQLKRESLMYLNEALETKTGKEKLLLKFSCKFTQSCYRKKEKSIWKISDFKKDR